MVRRFFLVKYEKKNAFLVLVLGLGELFSIILLGNGMGLALTNTVLYVLSIERMNPQLECIIRTRTGNEEVKISIIVPLKKGHQWKHLYLETNSTGACCHDAAKHNHRNKK